MSVESHLVTTPRVAVPSIIGAPTVQPFSDSTIEYEFYGEQTGEKEATGQFVAAQSVKLAHEFRSQSDRTESFNIFEGGLGSGVTTAAVVKAVYAAEPELPITVTAKEFSSDHVLHGLDVFAKIFEQQRNFAFAATNLPWTHAATLKEEGPSQEKPLEIIEVKLNGTTAAEFRAQFAGLQNQIEQAWQTKTKPTKKGNSVVPANQAVIIVSRADRDNAVTAVPRVNEDRQFHVANIIHAWKLAATDEFKANKIIAPVAQSLKCSTLEPCSRGLLRGSRSSLILR